MRNCLSDEELLQLEAQKLLGGKNVDLEDILRGQFSPNVYDYVARSLKLEGHNKPILVVLTPVVLIEKGAYGKSEKYERNVFSPLYVPAWIKPNGSLQIPTDEDPWISRIHLRPNMSSAFPLWGNLEEYQMFIKYQGTLKNCDTWRRYIDKCGRMLEESCFFTFTHVPPGFEVLGSKIVGIGDAIQRNQRPVYQLYDQLITQKKFNKLLTSFLENDSVETPKVLGDKEALSAEVLGSAHPEQTLSNEEKQLVFLAQQKNEGELLVGIGDEAQDHSGIMETLILDNWIQAALNREMPPLTFIATDSLTVDESLLRLLKGMNNKEHGLLGRRWLPEVRSFTTLCVSLGDFLENKSQFSGHHLFLDEDKIFPSLETAGYLEKAEPLFLKVAADYLGKAGDLKSAITLLHQELSEQVELLRNCIEKATDYMRIQPDIPARAAELMDTKDSIFSQAQDKINRAKQKKASFERLVEEESERLSLVSKITSKVNDATRHELVEERGTFLKKLGVEIPDDMDLMDLDAVLGIFDQMIAKLEGSLEKARPQFVQLEKNLAIQDEWFAFAKENMIDTSIENIDYALNKRFRQKIFLLASHYWEGVYLQTLQQKLKDSSEGKLQGGKQYRSNWQLRAMLTPCLISSLSVLPKLFHININNYNTIVQDAIDRLIIDHGSSTSPYRVIPSLVFAQQCIVLGSMGETLDGQGLSRGIEEGNLVSCGFEDPSFAKAMEKQGLLGESQSMTKVAQVKCIYGNFEGHQGVYFAEPREDTKDATSEDSLTAAS